MKTLVNPEESATKRLRTGIAIGIGYIAAGVTAAITEPRGLDAAQGIAVTDIVTGWTYHPSIGEALGSFMIACGVGLVTSGVIGIKELTKPQDGTRNE